MLFSVFYVAPLTAVREQGTRCGPLRAHLILRPLEDHEKVFEGEDCMLTGLELQNF
jgi:hypothetical protein